MAQSNQGLESNPTQVQVPLRNIKQDKYSISLQQAVRDGREEEVRKWLSSASGQRRKKALNAFDSFGFTAVHYAARFNRFKIMQLLYSEKADPNVKTEYGLTPLHYAARYTPISKSKIEEGDDTSSDMASNKQILQLLVLWRVNINVQDIYGVTPLHLACSRGNRVGVEVLIAIGAINVNIQDKQQDTPLHDACLLGDEWIVEQLLERDADVLITNDENLIPLHIACREGYTDVVKTMMRKRFQQCDQMVTSYDDQYNTALHFACRSGNVEIVKILFLNRADPTAVRRDGITPLHIAAREGFVEIATVLLEYDDLDINVRDEELNTPLHLAARHNEVDMIKFLLKKGADVEAQDINSNTPLLTAVAHGQMEAMETLIKSDCQVDVVDRNGKSIIFIAAEKNHAELLKTMLNGSVSEYCEHMLSTTDSTHNTPLHIACAKGSMEALKVLLRSSIKPDARNEADKTPMHLAAANGKTNVVKELIRHGKRIKIDLIVDEDDDSNTPLHLSCTNGHYNVSKVLLEEEADPDIRNVRHWTPMDCAAYKGWDRIIQLLIDFEAEIDPMDKARVTPLWLACREGHLKVVQVLLSNNAKASNTNEQELNCLDIAVENGHKDVAMAIVKSKQMVAALRNTTNEKNTPMRRIIKKMPEVAKEVFNRCAVSNIDEVGKEDPNYTITFNYEFLEDFSDKPVQDGGLMRAFSRRERGNGNFVEDGKSEVSSVIGDLGRDDPASTIRRPDGAFSTSWGPRKYDKSNHCLHILAKSKSVELLRHPIVTSLLNHKWKAYGQAVYFGNLFIYILFIIFLTTFALVVPPPGLSICRNGVTSDINGTDTIMCEDEVSTGRSIGIVVIGIIVIIFGLVKLLFEGFQLLKLGYKYFLDWINYIEIILYVGSIFFVFVFFNTCFCPTNGQWQIGALVVFLGWIDLVIYMRKFPVTGIFVVMFLNIFYIFLKLAFLAALLILSFAFSFYMVFHNPDNIINNIRTPFQDPGRSIIKTMTMTTGEFEFDNTFRQSEDRGPDLQYATVSYLLWILFLILMPILLTNLLVGLAVDDIKGIQQNAELKRLGLRVELTLTVEELLPRSWRRRFIIGERKINPNRKLNPFERFWYKALKFERFDDLETISYALNPPPIPITEVVDQSMSLNKKVDEMQLQLEALGDQNSKLLEVLEAIIHRDSDAPIDILPPKLKERAMSRPKVTPLSEADSPTPI